MATPTQSAPAPDAPAPAGPQAEWLRIASARGLRLAAFVSKAIGYLAYERRLGVQTGGIVLPGRLGIPNPDAIAYEASSWFALRRFLRADDVGADDVFLDIGSGKGRMQLAAASRYRFRRVMGVEASPELAAIARENIARARRHLRCGDVTTVEADAATYPIPDDVTVVYMFNPVHAESFVAVIAQLTASFDRRPRRLRVIYRNPTQETSLRHSARMRLCRATRWGLSQAGRWERIVMYELLPADAE